MSGWLTVADVQLEGVERWHGSDTLPTPPRLHGEEGLDQEGRCSMLAAHGHLLAQSHTGLAPRRRRSIDAVGRTGLPLLDCSSSRTPATPS